MGHAGSQANGCCQVQRNQRHSPSPVRLSGAENMHLFGPKTAESSFTTRARAMRERGGKDLREEKGEALRGGKALGGKGWEGSQQGKGGKDLREEKGDLERP